MLHVACFSLTQEQKSTEDEAGGFEVLIEANDVDEAGEVCRLYLTKIVEQGSASRSRGS